MAYSNQSKINIISPPQASTVTMTSAKNTTVYMTINQPCIITSVGVMISTTSDSDAATCTVTRRVTLASDTNAVAVATIYIPIAATAGSIIYDDITPQNANAGDQLKFVFSNHGGSVAWIPWIEAYGREEVKANNSDFVASVAV
jgi:hypothetical protein